MNRAGDRGAGTVLVLAVCAGLVALGAGLGVLGQAAVARHRAEAAADLAALAAADVLLGRAAGDACARAEGTAAANRATLASCEVGSGSTVAVVVRVRPAGAAALLGPATGRARAGPAP